MNCEYCKNEVGPEFKLTLVVHVGESLSFFAQTHEFVFCSHSCIFGHMICAMPKGLFNQEWLDTLELFRTELWKLSNADLSSGVLDEGFKRTFRKTEEEP